MLHKAKRAIERPDLVYPYLENKLENVRYGTIDKYLRKPYLDDKAKYKMFNGDQIYVSTNDIGLSRDLAKMGIREPITTRAYLDELEKLSECVDETIILEFGANIGYYALLAANVIDEGSILAVEVDPSNTHILQKNIETNGYEDLVDVEQIALGTEVGTHTVFKSERANRTTLNDISDEVSHIENKYETDTIPPDTLLEQKNILESDVNVLRMDMEGFELKILPQMDSIITQSDELLINIEVHPGMADDEDVNRTIDTLEAGGLDIISGAKFSPSQNRSVPLESFSNIRDHGFIEIVAKKGF